MALLVVTFAVTAGVQDQWAIVIACALISLVLVFFSARIVLRFRSHPEQIPSSVPAAPTGDGPGWRNWQRRNRTWISLVVWLLIVLSSAKYLVSGDPAKIVGWVLLAWFWGLLNWFSGSRDDRRKPRLWGRLAVGWAIWMAAIAAVVIVGALRGHFNIQITPLTAIGALFLAGTITAYRNTSRADGAGSQA
jgi:hypothetical protein